MNQFKSSSNEDQKKYRRLKSNWKLLLKDENELNYSDYKWNRSFRKVTTQKAMVDEMLSFSKELKLHYRIYQDFLWAIRNKDTEEFQAVIDNRYDDLNGRFTTTLKTFKKFRREIINDLENPYSNGPLEATNNKIKVIKRVAYGFRSFTNFKKRILVCQQILKPTA
jgi:transposase